MDQRRASDEQRRANLEYLSRAQVLQVPGPFRFEMSTFDGPDILADDNIAQVDKAISAIVLPRGRMPGNSGKLMQDVHHLIAHLMAENDVFVALDDDDMIKKRDRLRSEVGIRVKTPAEAVSLAPSRA